MTKCSGLMAVAAMAILIAGCGGQDGGPGNEPDAAPLLTAETLGEQVILSEQEYLAAEPYASADRENGEKQAAYCRACHSLEQGGTHMIGPALFGFFGSQAGTQQGFGYSAVLRDADFAWTPRALDAWLVQPGRFLPGNGMTFAGVPDQGDRNDLIAYLLDVTDSGER